ncbi:alpha/beta fold hydrolase [Aliifodinibius sp. S!AR15-10]|uniref:alpha/beta fold hydrolase n=1 Tax=Aliifodinibius sp. S!AR15-10 TaxID=2950437 RepID=UPI002866DF1B|nr:alpha/beta fold hydrolase [Aliifodinibius sp. S!AR15-10]MDR8390800.1 alpha/beta fold hydrolase [Aliifodinibius sp. S!AR15-10]
MTLISHSHEWINQIEYPFKHHYIELEDGTMHYVDEGSRETLLFVHGTPTWSFLYRNFIKELSKHYRVIAIDHIGFGLSEKPETFKGRPQDHAHNLSEFIRKKNLREITLVLHDFGGPIGLAAAIKNPSRFKQFVLFNTWLWETASNKKARKVDKIINSVFGKFLYLWLNFSPRFLLKQGFADKRNLPKKIREQYLLPFPVKSSRWSLYRIAQSLVGASDWYHQQWQQLSAIEDKPWLILWGTEDEFITIDYLQRWKHRLPHAEVYTFDCGHFVQEERPESALSKMKAFLSQYSIAG